MDRGACINDSTIRPHTVPARRCRLHLEAHIPVCRVGELEVCGDHVWEGTCEERRQLKELVFDKPASKLLRKTSSCFLIVPQKSLTYTKTATGTQPEIAVRAKHWENGQLIDANEPAPSHLHWSVCIMKWKCLVMYIFYTWVKPMYEKQGLLFPPY